MTEVTIDVPTVAGPAGLPGATGPVGPAGAAGKDGVSPVLDMTALSAAVAKILAGSTIVVPPPVVTPPASTGTPVGATNVVIIAQNGVTPLLPQDYSYGATDVRVDVVDGGNGNPARIEVVGTAAWPGFQPSDTNGVARDLSATDTMCIDIFAEVGAVFSVQCLTGGDVGIFDANGQQTFFQFTQSVAGWQRHYCKTSDVMTDAKKGNLASSFYKSSVQAKTTVVGYKWGVDNWLFYKTATTVVTG